MIKLTKVLKAGQNTKKIKVFWWQNGKAIDVIFIIMNNLKIYRRKKPTFSTNILEMCRFSWKTHNSINATHSCANGESYSSIYILSNQNIPVYFFVWYKWRIIGRLYYLLATHIQVVVVWKLSEQVYTYHSKSRILRTTDFKHILCEKCTGRWW